MIVALRNASKQERSAILKVVRRKNKSKADVTLVTDFVHRSDGLTYARNQMFDLADEARELLSLLADSPSRQSLEDIVDYIVARNI